MGNQQIALVIGATGNQGGATARHLLGRGWEVRVFVRDPGKPKARQLRERGATLVQGDLEDTDSLRRAMHGVHGVFSVQALAHEPATLAAEVRQGKTVADVAAEIGVDHLVYSSVGGAERETGIDHFESKAEIERHIGRLGLPATILRPVFFMDNLLYYTDAEAERILKLPVLPDRPMQMIASDDIGRIAAHVLDRPDGHLGRQIEIAGDELSFEQVAEIYQRTDGVPTRLEPLPIEDRMFEWFAESGYRADLADLRTRFGPLTTFEDFLNERLAES